MVHADAKFLFLFFSERFWKNRPNCRFQQVEHVSTKDLDDICSYAFELSQIMKMLRCHMDYWVNLYFTASIRFELIMFEFHLKNECDVSDTIIELSLSLSF